MSILQPRDMSVWPRWLCEGRKAQEQVLIAYIWAYALEGKEWTCAELGRVCGCVVNASHLDHLVEQGILCVVPEGERKNVKACHAYGVACDMTPSDRKATAKAEKPKHDPMPLWVFAACAIWREHQGIIGPKQMMNMIKPVVATFGESRAMAGLDRYARRADKRFYPSLYKFAAQAKQWMPDDEDGAPKQRSLADLVPEQKQEEAVDF